MKNLQLIHYIPIDNADSHNIVGNNMFKLSDGIHFINMKKTFSIFIFYCYTVLTIAQNPTEFWGTTMLGGSGLGTFFKTDSAGGNLMLAKALSNNEGEQPSGTLTLGTNGKIYAVTHLGGAYNNGVLIECDPAINTGTITKKIDFNRTLTGANPKFSPVQAANGKLYGTTEEGGTENQGTIYEYDPATGVFNKKFDFTSLNGKNPNGLVKASNNKLYGLTKYGGSKGGGILFEFDPSTGIFTKKSEFPNHTQGTQGYSDGNLIQASNGKLYGLGVTFLSSTQKEMTLMLFEYDIPGNTLTVKFVNDSENYQISNFFCGSLVEVPGGKLYGLKAYRPGIFEYDIATSSFEVKYNSKSGEANQGTLMLASNGKLYGLSVGGLNNKGVLFEYDYLTATYTTKFDFDGPHGTFYLNVANNTLLEVCKSIPYQTVSDTVTTSCEQADFTIKSGLTKSDYSFQWYKDEKIIDTATSENLDFLSLKPSDAGVYFCKVNNGCRVIQTQNNTLKVKDCSVGIPEKVTNTLFKMYPNPANDQVTIQIKNSTVNKVSIELIDLVGRSVYIEDLVEINSENSAALNISNLTKGVYVLKITNLQTNSVGYEKLIKE